MRDAAYISARNAITRSMCSTVKVMRDYRVAGERGTGCAWLRGNLKGEACALTTLRIYFGDWTTIKRKPAAVEIDPDAIVAVAL